MCRPLSLLSAFALIFFLAACDTAEERAEEHYQNALSLLEEGDHERALIELRNVFRLVPIHLDARYAMADLLLEHSENPRPAYREYLRIAEQAPNDLEPRIRLAEIAVSLADWEELARHGSKAVELAPDNAEVRVIKAVMDYQEAVTSEDATTRRELAGHAQRLLNANPDAVILREILLDHALRETQLTEALALLDVMTEAAPSETRLWNKRLQILVQLGDDAAIEAQLLKLVELDPDNLEQKAMLIRYYLSKGDLDKTESFLRELVEAAPETDFGPRTDLIRFLAANRGPEIARAEINDAIDTVADPLPYVVIGAALDFENGLQDRAIMDLEAEIEKTTSEEHINTAKVSLARMLIGTGNDVGARALVEEVLVNEPSNPAALKMSARWSINADDPDGAIAKLRIALDQNADDAETLTLMAEAYSRTGSTDLSRDFLSLAVEASGNAPQETVRYAQLLISEERYLPAEDVLLPALRLAPADLSLLNMAGQLYLSMDDQGRARQVVDTLRRIGTPEAIRIAVPVEAELLNRAEGISGALEFLQTLTENSESDIGAEILLIRALLASGDVETALERAEDANQNNPDSAPARLVLATTLSAAGNAERALLMFDEMIADYPDEPGLYLQKSALLRRTGDFEGARLSLATGLEVFPDSSTLLWALATLNEQEGDIDGAITIYDTLYSNLNSQGSDSVVVANNLASLLATYRDDEVSLDRAWTIARRFRTNEIPAIQDTYGWIIHRRGESEEALTYLNNAASALTNDPIVQYHLAEVLYATGDLEEALTKYREVLGLVGAGDTRPQVEASRSRIAELEQEQSAPATE